MFDLLPQQEKKNLTKEYRLRFVTVSLMLLGSLGVLALTVLTPSYFLSYQKEKEAQAEHEILKREIEQGSKDELSGILNLAGKQAKLLKAFSPASYTFELVGNVVQSKSPDIQIMGLRIIRNEDESREVAVIGKAENRDALLAFVQVLESEPAFSLVTVPVSNCADASDINFSILVKAK